MRPFISEDHVLGAGVGIVIGLVTGAFLGEGVVNQGTGVVFAAFLAMTGVLHQVRANARHANDMDAQDLHRKELRVANILSAELLKVLNEVRACVLLEASAKKAMDEAVASSDELIELWKKNPTDTVPATRSTQYFLPSYQLRYFEEHFDALEYLPIDISGPLVVVMERLKGYKEKTETEMLVQSIRSTLPGTFEGLRLFYDTVQELLMKVVEHRNRLAGTQLVLTTPKNNDRGTREAKPTSKLTSD